MTTETPYTLGTIVRFRLDTAKQKDIGYISRIFHKYHNPDWYYDVTMFSDGVIITEPEWNIVPVQESDYE